MGNFTQRMKALTLVCLSGVAVLSAQGVYQLPNPDFEQWEIGVNLNGTPAKNNTIEPIGWNSFRTATSTNSFLLNMASGNFAVQENRGTAELPNYYVQITSKSILGIIANGTVTTGIINVGSMTATDPSNHNFTSVLSTEVGADNFRQKFSGYPDAMKVKVQYVPGAAKPAKGDFTAQVSAWIHTEDANFQDPYEASIAEKAVAKAVLNPDATMATDWTEFVVPFDYTVGNEGNVPAYILISATTNKTPGAGAGGDVLRIDDLYLVYYSTLSDLKVDGVSVADFEGETTEYNFEGVAPELSSIEASVKGKGAIVEVTSTQSKGSTIVTTISVTVKGNDFDISGNKTVYNLIYTDKLSSIEEGSLDKSEVSGGQGSIQISNYQGLAEVYNLSGVKVYSQQVDNKIEINLPAGVYAVKTLNGGTTVLVK